jgi:hypothetical protein
MALVPGSIEERKDVFVRRLSEVLIPGADGEELGLRRETHDSVGLRAQRCESVKLPRRGRRARALPVRGAEWRVAPLAWWRPSRRRRPRRSPFYHSHAAPAGPAERDGIATPPRRACSPTYDNDGCRSADLYAGIPPTIFWAPSTVGKQSPYDSPALLRSSHQWTMHRLYQPRSRALHPVEHVNAFGAHDAPGARLTGH